MKIQINAPWEVNDYLKSTIYEKLEKLETFYQRIIQAEVYLKLDSRSIVDNKIVEVRIYIPDNDLFAKTNADSFEKAIAAVTEKLERQLKKRKGKSISHS